MCMCSVHRSQTHHWQSRKWVCFVNMKCGTKGIFSKSHAYLYLASAIFCDIFFSSAMLLRFPWLGIQGFHSILLVSICRYWLPSQCFTFYQDMGKKLFEIGVQIFCAQSASLLGYLIYSSGLTYTLVLQLNYKHRLNMVVYISFKDLICLLSASYMPDRVALKDSGQIIKFIKPLLVLFKLVMSSSYLYFQITMMCIPIGFFVLGAIK